MGKLNFALSPEARRRGLVAMLALAGLLLVDVVYQAGWHLRWRAWIARQGSALQAAQASATQPAAKETPKPPEIAAALRKRNIFTAPKPKGHGFTLTGVLFDRALFNRREGGPVALKEGESAGPVTLKSINGYEVVIEYEGKPETLKLFGPGGGPGAPAAPGGSPPVIVGSPTPTSPIPAGIPAQIRRVPSMALPAGVDLSDLPPEIRAQLESRMNRPPG